jgi:hypothetical protein
MEHYVTCAAFFLKRSHRDIHEPIINCSASNDSLYGDAVLRKLCICGSTVSFDEEEVGWLCRDTGERLEVVGRNLEPLLPPQAMSPKLAEHITEFSNPGFESIPIIDERGNLHVLSKVPEGKIWVIQDPLPVFDNVTIERIGLDLLLKWNLWIGESSTGEIDVEINFNIVDPAHESILALLASECEFTIHFFSSESTIAVASKQIKPGLGETYRLCTEKVRAVLQALPKVEDARLEALDLFELSRSASQMSWAEKSGICLEPLYLLSNSRSLSLENLQELTQKLKDHAKTCERCRESFSAQE